MTTPEISIIVPVYNVEKYLNRCIDSIINQTFNDLEIILVDDGSKDASAAICDRYAEKDERIRVIHKANGGLSDARNAGIEIANGKWIGFVDSDDYIACNMYSELHRLVMEYNSEIGVCGVCDCYDNIEIVQNREAKQFVCSGIDALKYTLEGKLLAGTICNKIIKHNIIKEKRFLYGKTYEDAFFTPELFLDSNSVACTTEPLYYYWHRANSITTQSYSIKRLDIVDAYTYTKGVVLERCPELTEYAEFRLHWAHFIVIDSMLLQKSYADLPHYVEIRNYLKKEWFAILKNPFFKKSRRIAALIFKINVRLYRILVYFNNKKKGIIE